MCTAMRKHVPRNRGQVVTIEVSFVLTDGSDV